MRALLRAPFGNELRIAVEREPDLRIAAGAEGDRHHLVAARDTRLPRLVGMGSRSVRRAWVNGRRARIGYLGLLRSVGGLSGRRRLLARAYDTLEATREADEVGFDLTAIVEDNPAARRLLERGVRGLPIYRPWCSLRTLVIPVGRRRGMPRGIERGTDERLPALVRCLNADRARYQFGPAWSVTELRSTARTPGLVPEDFVVAVDRGQLVGTLACWDQRPFKQTVVRGYGGRLRQWRWAVQSLHRLGLGPPLPPPGHELPVAYLSHLSCPPDRPDILLSMIRGASDRAAERGVRYLLLGLAESHPLRAEVERALRPIVYRSCLYVVYWPERTAEVEAVEDRVPHVELATL